MMRLILVVGLLVTATRAHANLMDDMNPFDPRIEQSLPYLDQLYSEETGLSPMMPPTLMQMASCKRASCPLWIVIDKKTQTFNVYVENSLIASWQTSTGRDGYETPDFDRHPNGRIYESYMSRAYPSAEIKGLPGLGNMPYAVFIEGGFAIHGTDSLWRLGTAASHGCIRLEPKNAQTLNALVRNYGINKTWITVQ